MAICGVGWELHLGRWQDSLGGVTADCLISDPPYSARTHSGHDAATREDGYAQHDLGYSAWGEVEVQEFVERWSSIAGWFVVLTDHVLAPVYEAALSASGRYTFAPLPYVAPGSRVRLQGDGPSSWTTWVVVSRPRRKPYSNWGTLKGAYVQPKGYGQRPVIPGGKTEWIMRQLVLDYSRAGELIVDPCAGAGTTLLAAVQEGRRGIGAEVNPDTFAIATDRLANPYTPPLGLE